MQDDNEAIQRYNEEIRSYIESVQDGIKSLRLNIDLLKNEVELIKIYNEMQESAIIKHDPVEGLQNKIELMEGSIRILDGSILSLEGYIVRSQDAHEQKPDKNANRMHICNVLQYLIEEAQDENRETQADLEALKVDIVSSSNNSEDMLREIESKQNGLVTIRNNFARLLNNIFVLNVCDEEIPDIHMNFHEISTGFSMIESAIALLKTGAITIKTTFEGLHIGFTLIQQHAEKIQRGFEAILQQNPPEQNSN